MLSAAIRVLARSAALQIEEAAVASPSLRQLQKGKGKAVDQRIRTEYADQSTDIAGNPSSSSSKRLSDDVLFPHTMQEPRDSAKHDAAVNRPSARLTDATRNPTTIRQDSEPLLRKPVQDSRTRDPPISQTQEQRLSGATSPHGADPAGLANVAVLPSHPPRPDPPTTTVNPEPFENHSAQPRDVVEEPMGSTTSSSSLSKTDTLEGNVTPTTLPDTESAEVSATGDADEDAPVLLRASRVPSSRIGRLFHYGSLAASLSFGAASESLRRTTGGGGQGSVFMSDANVRRLVSTLGRMRGAALKLGQFMSIQDNHMLPAEIEKVLQQVQAHANYMPDWQMEKVMSTELGPEWQTLFSSFDRVPFASASIGQVHRGVLASTGQTVAVKVQFPGIASSINSDLANLSILIRSSALLPKGLYLQNTIAVMRRELEDECDYVREAASGKRFEGYLHNDPFFLVPKVVDEATTGKVLTTDWMGGKPLSRMKGMSQETRDKIGENILRLCLQELFHFRFMQTDPNWANFLYDAQNDKIQLIDFGASREYTKDFMDGWYRLLKGAQSGDRESMRIESLNLGYLTGEENEEMLKAHLDSMALIASPFAHEGKYPFANQTITDSVRELIPIMLRHRLTPPPPETYSLNRKLSGAFLMCAKLGAHVDCNKLWKENVIGYKEG